MNELLKLISERAIELADFDFTQEQTENKWLGNIPALENEIKLTEKRLGIELPADFKLFLSKKVPKPRGCLAKKSMTICGTG